MIQVIHGKNTTQSYQRLKSLTESYPKDEKAQLSGENSYEDLYQITFTQNLIDDKKLIICQNFLSSKKIKADDKLLTQIPKDQKIIFWEADTLTADILKKLPKDAIIEVFKPEPKSFWFLDSITPNSKISLSKLKSLEGQENGRGLLASIASRVLLLVLAKSDFDLKTSSQVTGYNLQDWQWGKIKNQAAHFSLEGLTAFFNGILKADLMIKTGVTSASEATLASLLLIKYLRV